MSLRPGRIGEWAKDVEDRPQADLLARSHRVPHRGMKFRREHEAQAVGLKDSLHRPWLEIARFPCLATTTPAAATTNMAIVDTLNVVRGAPPVPQRSTTRPFGGGRIAAHRSRIAVAMPAISSGPSPFIRNPRRNAPIWAGLACPSMISAIASCAPSYPRDLPVAKSAIASRIIGGPPSGNSVGGRVLRASGSIPGGTGRLRRDASDAAPP